MATADLSLVKNAIHMTNGEPDVGAEWVAGHLGHFRFIDVREPHELQGPLGHAPDVENVPLLQLLGGGVDLDPEVPLVLICRSGRRSTLAARELRNRGLKCVASVEGGMMAWNADVWGKRDIARDEKWLNARNLGEATFNHNGFPEVSADWVFHNLGRFRLVDVREPHELEMAGAVAQAENIPLQRFLSGAGALDRDQPIVVMCASGGRSGRVVTALKGAGFTNVASMEGGIFGWRMRGLPHATPARA